MKLKRECVFKRGAHQEGDSAKAVQRLDCHEIWRMTSSAECVAKYIRLHLT
jgi:hypothetical protein